MRYPQLLLIPVLMLADYYLTLIGAVVKERSGYDNHFKVLHYELNPVWQEAIRRKRWFNPRHLLLVALVTGLIAYGLELTPRGFGERGAMLADFLFSWFFASFGMIIGRHLSNIMIFRAIARRPDQIAGEIAMGHSLQLTLSTVQYLVGVVPLAIIAGYAPSPISLGAIVGALQVCAIHLYWQYRHRSRMNRGDEENA